MPIIANCVRQWLKIAEKEEIIETNLKYYI